MIIKINRDELLKKKVKKDDFLRQSDKKNSHRGDQREVSEPTHRETQVN